MLKKKKIDTFLCPSVDILNFNIFKPPTQVLTVQTQFNDTLKSKSAQHSISTCHIIIFQRWHQTLSVTSAHVRRHLRQKTWQQLSGMASSPPARTPRQMGHLSASSASAPSGGPWPPKHTGEEKDITRYKSDLFFLASVN